MSQSWLCPVGQPSLASVNTGYPRPGPRSLLRNSSASITYIEEEGAPARAGTGEIFTDSLDSEWGN